MTEYLVHERRQSRPRAGDGRASARGEQNDLIGNNHGHVPMAGPAMSFAVNPITT
jgi:hypothetical protein